VSNQIVAVTYELSAIDTKGNDPNVKVFGLTGHYVNEAVKELMDLVCSKSSV
jgi:hypothetical protein